MPAPPLLGYNNNVRHRGRIFHIQTEDSGVGSPRIMTHLFADGGRIVKSTRTDYSEHVGRPEMVEVVKNMMKDQHKAMFVALRSGQLDEIIGFDSDEPPPSLALGTLSGTESAPLSLHGSAVVPSSGAQSSGASSAGVPSSSATQPVSETQVSSSSAGAQSVRGASPPSTSIPHAPPSSGVPSSAPRTPRAARPDAKEAAAPGTAAANPAAAVPSPGAAGKGGTPSERPYAAPRPAAIFSVPPSGSIFGDVGIDEKSLDDAILSYLAEDPKKKD